MDLDPRNGRGADLGATLLLGTSTAAFLGDALVPWPYRAADDDWVLGADLPRLAAVLAALALGLVLSTDARHNRVAHAAIPLLVGVCWLGAVIGLTVLASSADAAVVLGALAAVLALVAGGIATRLPVPEPVAYPFSSEQDPIRSVDW